MNLLNPDVRICIKIWTAILSEFLGWSRAQVIDWAQQYEDDIVEDKWPFNHETLVYYVIPLLVPESLRAKMKGLELLHLKNRIERAIKGYGASYANVDEYDWKAAKQRTESILSEYGESLATAAREHSPER